MELQVLRENQEQDKITGIKRETRKGWNYKD